MMRYDKLTYPVKQFSFCSDELLFSSDVILSGFCAVDAFRSGVPKSKGFIKLKGIISMCLFKYCV